jgi:hypothetical protein
MPDVHDHATGAPSEGRGLFRSAELLVVLAAAVAAGALLLALLAVAAERTDLLLLDFREWRPVASGVGEPSRSPLEGYFNGLQAGPPARRPFRLTLQLESAAGGLGFLAAERELPAAAGELYCFRVLASTSAPVTAGGLGIAVYVNDAVAWSTPLAGPVRGYAVAVSGIRPRRGKVKIRLELRSSNWQPSPPVPAPAVRFEYASFRRCEDRGPEGQAPVRAAAPGAR